MNDDDYTPDDLDDLLESTQELFRKDVQKHILNNKDDRQKEIGDNVRVWDTSRLTEVEGNILNTDLLDHQIITTFNSIVIEVGCRYVATVTIGDRHYDKLLDLKIWNKVLNKVYRTSSDFVKIIEE